jgi:3-deoxy-manno-octulosonate cytidylyltransferase (CMP-KDO synthetase)
LVLLVYRFPCKTMRRSKVIGIIPARLGSRRIVQKPLTPINGKPLIQNIYERAAKSKLLDRVLVATNSPRVSDLVFAFGGEAHISLKNHLTGSDRVAEAARNLNYELIINIQCDLPDLSPALIDELVSAMLREPGVGMGTLATRITDPAKLKNPHVVKVVLDRKAGALYFSRRPIPYVRSDRVSGARVPGSAVDLRRTGFYEHIGIYGFRRSFLMRFASWEQTPLEKAEKLEQLRALENGARIKVYLTKRKPVSLDVPSDLKRLRTPKGRMVR